MENTFAVEIQGLTKSFKDFKALDTIDLNIKHGEKVVICGPSGSGKSTLIRCINGLEDFDEGKISISGNPQKPSKDSFVSDFHIGMVFQQFNLFPHLSVIENLKLGPVKSLGFIFSFNAGLFFISLHQLSLSFDKKILFSSYFHNLCNNYCWSLCIRIFIQFSPM